MVSTIIAKSNGRDKVIDFRDGLVPAYVNDYAMMHGAGGSHHAPTSVIKIVICDYTAGTGEASRTVSANISPELCEQLLEVCKHNIGTYVIPDNFTPLVEQRAANAKAGKAADLLFGILRSVTKVTGALTAAWKGGKNPDKAVVMESLQSRLTKVEERGMQPAEQMARPACHMVPAHMDYSYMQDRVHNFANRTGGGDIAPVQRLTISHTSYRKQGDLSNYPWTVKITNGKAKVRVQPTGATTFDSRTMTDVEEAFIQVSDADMFRMVSRVCRYIAAWEGAVAADNIRKGLDAAAAERIAYRNQQDAVQNSQEG